MNKTGIIILAAGNSSRLGRPKQLLPYRDSTLLSYVVSEALKAYLQPAVVVMGAYHEEIQASLKGQPVEIVFNPDWEKGMGSGIVAGLTEALASASPLQAVIVAVCDQPHISAGLFRALVSTAAGLRKGLVACEYAGTMGTPVLFDQKYFKELLALSGDTGAKQLLKRYPGDVSKIPFPEGAIDIDTEEDFQQLKKYAK